MIRNLKTLGLAFVAVLALGAVYASAASAQQGTLTTENDDTATLTGEEVGAEAENRLTAFGAYVQCPGSTYTGHTVVTQHETETNPELEHGFLHPGATEVTITPEYNQPNCGGPFGWTATVEMNGCDYDATIGETVEDKENTYDVTFDVTCPKDKDITVKLWRNTDHTGEPFCIIHVPAQENLTGAHVTDETNGHLRLGGKVEGINATMTRTGAHTTLLCTNKSEENAKFDLNATVDAHNELDETIDIGLHHAGA